MDGKSSIKAVLKQYSDQVGTDISIGNFKILVLGEGIDKEEKDFASEVAETVKQLTSIRGDFEKN